MEMEKQEMKVRDDEKQEKNDNYNPLPGEPVTAQEYHHARHALYFLYFGTYSVINHKVAWCTGDKADRVSVHLNCLREFVEQDTVLGQAVNVLLRKLSQSRPCDHKEWGHFLFQNWTSIHQIAAHYGEDKKCFPDSYYCALKQLFEING
jgi:hypothetical protein